MEVRVLDMDASDNDKTMVSRKTAVMAPDRKKSFSYASVGNYGKLRNDDGLPLRTCQQAELEYCYFYGYIPLVEDCTKT